MLACADSDSRELALGPCIPHFYGVIVGGADARGNLFIFTNTNGMMGSLGGMPEVIALSWRACTTARLGAADVVPDPPSCHHEDLGRQCGAPATRGHQVKQRASIR
jgi:hypothetical protein